MTYYRLTHFFITKRAKHFHFFPIGIYGSKSKAGSALAELMDKPGFACDPMLFGFVRFFA